MTAIVVDGSVHSGMSMLTACQHLEKQGLNRLITYALVVKKGAGLIPSYFGIVIGDEDRAYFGLDKIPNNRLHSRAPVAGHIRRIEEDDIHRAPIDLNQPQVEVSFGELLYAQKAKGYQVYLYVKDGAPRGYLAAAINNDRFFIDIVGTDRRYQGQGVAGALLRWSETLARNSGCRVIELWAIDRQIKFYESLRFRLFPDKRVDYDSQTSFTYMTRDLLPNTSKGCDSK